MTATDPNPEDLAWGITELRKRAVRDLAGRVITIMSGKGGMGKTFFAMELAWLLDAVLIDLDWDGGCASRAMGYFWERFKTAPLLDAFESGKTPKPRRESRRPDYVPSHTDLEANQPQAGDLAALLARWAKEWGRPVVCDTHPGGSPATLGACAAADLVIHPVVLGTRELNALEQTLNEMGNYPMLLVPNSIPFTPPAAERQRFAAIAHTYDARVSESLVREFRWMRTRKSRTVITAAASFSARSLPVAEDMVMLGEEVITLAS